MRKEISEAECAHGLAVRLLSALPDTAGVSHRRCTGPRVPLACRRVFIPLKRDARSAFPVYYALNNYLKSYTLLLIECSQ
jgi:hypothetical protein